MRDTYEVQDEIMQIHFFNRELRIKLSGPKNNFFSTEYRKAFGYKFELKGYESSFIIHIQ